MNAGESTSDLEESVRRAPEAESLPTLILAFSDRGLGAPERLMLSPGGVRLGREAKLFSTGLKDDSISRNHAEIKPREGRFWLHDLGSRNGTWINGKRVVDPQRLERGDVIRLGVTLLVYAHQGSDPTGASSVAPSLVGESDAIAAVRRSIGLVAGKGRAVLVTGETGTGKELVAEELHKESRRSGRFVAVNCGALSEEVLASELFGHVRGAFTGAVSDRPGLFRAADGGTLLLDEIGELPRELQPKLLRALEVGRVRPVGGTEEVAVDVAVVGATNRDLVASVRDGHFRADLYARLSQWLIELPPLRARREDIPWLMRDLLARAGAAGRRMTVGLAEALLLHPWPLNVRGLFNALSIAALANATDEPLDLRAEVRGVLDAARAIAGEEAPPQEKSARIPEAQELEQALAATSGNVKEAAKRLGCSRQQLYRWLDLRGVARERFRG